jgi:hypothetical protein
MGKPVETRHAGGNVSALARMLGLGRVYRLTGSRKGIFKEGPTSCSLMAGSRSDRPGDWLNAARPALRQLHRACWPEQAQ